MKPFRPGVEGQFVFCLKEVACSGTSRISGCLSGFSEFFPHLLQAGAGFSGASPADNKAYSHGFHLHLNQRIFNR